MCYHLCYSKCTQMTNQYTRTSGVLSTQMTYVLQHSMHHLRRPSQPSATAPNGYSLLVVGVPQCHSRGDCSGEHCANCIHLPRLSGRPVFWGSRPCVPAAWLAERLLLAGDIESNPGPRPTLKTPTHTHTQPPTLTKYTDSLI